LRINQLNNPCKIKRKCSDGTNLRNYRSDIILSPILIGERNKFIAQLLKIIGCIEKLLQILVPYHFPQTIRAEQEDITWLYDFTEDINLNILMSSPQRAIDDIALRMSVDSFRGNLISFYQACDQ